MLASPMWSVRCLLLVGAMLVSAHARAAEPASTAHRELRLSWVRTASASSCPDVGHVEADVEHRLGWSPFVRSSGPAESIEATVDRNAELWRASIELRAADGTSLGSRIVESPANTCASLAAAAGLAIALMIEPLLPPDAPVAADAVSVPPAKPSPVPAAPTKPEKSTSSDASSAASSAAQTDPRSSVALGALGVVNVLPKFALGVTLLSSVRLADRVYAVVSGSLLPEQPVTRGSGDVGFGMTLGTVGACYRVPITERFNISSCASLMLASMQVTVNNPEPVAAGARLWWAGGAGLRLGWNLGHFEVALGVEALGHPVRHSYLIERAEPVSSTSTFTEPAVGAAASLTAGARY
jgi:hypothetical protein